MEPFHIKFTCSDSDRVAAAENAFLRIQQCKENGEWPDSVEGWQTHFDEQALAHFWWPTASELETYRKLVFTVPVDERHKDPRLQHPWDFMSMMEAFKNGDYELESFEPAGDEHWMISFEPLGHPYGGIGCMKAFLQAFDMNIVEAHE